MSDSVDKTNQETKLSGQTKPSAEHLHCDPVKNHSNSKSKEVEEVSETHRVASKEGVEVSNENKDDKKYDNNERDKENNKFYKTEKEEGENKNNSKKLLSSEESVTIEIATSGDEGNDTPTLPLQDKMNETKIDCEAVDENQTGKTPVYLSSCTKIQDAWRDSTNIWSFIHALTFTVIEIVKWLTCTGVFPFLSLVMLIIGSIYVKDCKIEPNIPIYLIVSGVIGVIQRVIKISTKYVPEDFKSRLKIYKKYFNYINEMFHIFVLVWFINGCIWIYSVHSEVQYQDRENDKYCHKTLYQFAFWILNLSFIVVGLVVVLGICSVVSFACSLKE